VRIITTADLSMSLTLPYSGFNQQAQQNSCFNLTVFTRFVSSAIITATKRHSDYFGFAFVSVDYLAQYSRIQISAASIIDPRTN